ncbi:DUF2259 domain-containing protein [Ciceribacter ferrooxidans]|uniref:DUF2259 domain-containing protein n=1 Tax=Ciceribacter ferrooxidans TaxID=2509717 RepID=A0A4Q2T1I2_9HYPH|nr:DUF2259 domain-containing protein [Ciceribacter ferrooxidans]RYC12282.1 DUF2259 domain-containing protein [Ciceribacter ferrooxidans]
MRGLRGSLAGLTAGLALAATPALAGDIAGFRSIGFSGDGKIYAFEEYGVQDGSGFPYSNIYFLDTVKDAYLPGTPIRVRIDDEQAGLGAARAEAAQKASPLIESNGLADEPGQVVTLNPMTEVDSDAHRLRYLPFPGDPPFGKPHTLALEEYALPPPPACKDIVDEVKGFRLRLTERDGAASDDLVHEDDRLPASRNCATGYRLAGVVTHTPSGTPPVHMALVLVLSFGFEGRDGRWIAVPVHP